MVMNIRFPLTHDVSPRLSKYQHLKEDNALWEWLMSLEMLSVPTGTG